jgi:hypothetical protein
MRATAAQNVRVQQPVYHLALSFDPGDVVDRAAMEHVADRVLAALELENHQVLMVSHRDRGHPHVHILVNRVHPDTGKAWDRWQDQRIIQQTLREEELALGLRVVPGRLAPRQDRETTDIARQARGDAFPVSPAAVRASRRQVKTDVPPPGLSRVDEVAHDLQTHERVVLLTRERYLAQVDASAAHARATQLEASGKRVSIAVAAFDRALADVYRDPEPAHRAYVEAVVQRGVTSATQMLREHPDQFGELKSIERTGTFGLIRSQDTSAARAAAPLAALKGREMVEALRDFEHVAAEVSTRRLNDAFMRPLRAIFQEPLVARTSFAQLADQHGVEQATNALRLTPETFGEIRMEVRQSADLLKAHGNTAAELALESFHAQAGTATGLAMKWGARLQAETEATRLDAEQAVTRERTVRRRLRGLPPRADLEHKIARLLDELRPREVRQLRKTVSVPQLALATKLNAAIRDAVLGRDDERAPAR